MYGITTCTSRNRQTYEDNPMASKKTYLARCNACGRNTSKSYARQNGGKCKSCVHPEQAEAIDRVRQARERDHASLIDSGYQAYARERGDYDLPDSW
jgi:hypothetical protein